jgi:hypothetical protein
MKWLFEQLACVSGLLVLAAAAASAQGPATGAHSQWSATLSMLESYEDNVNFSPATQGNYDTGSRFQAGLARDWISARTDINVNGTVSQQLYRNASDLNALFYGVGGGASYAVTPRLSWKLADTLTSNYAQNTAVLIDAGIVLPKVLTRSNVGSSTLSYAASPRTQLSWAVSQQNIWFDSSSVPNGPGFDNGSTFGSRVGFSRQLTRSQSLGVQVGYQRLLFADTVATNLDLLGTWHRPIGKDSGLSIAGGVQAYSVPGQAGYRSSPAGSITLNTHVRRSDVLTFSYRRALEQAFGLGRAQVTDVVGGSYGMTVSKRLSAGFNGTYGNGTDAQNPNLRLIGRSAGVSISYLVGRGLTVLGGYNFLASQDGLNPTTVNHRAVVSLIYAKTWQ